MLIILYFATCNRWQCALYTLHTDFCCSLNLICRTLVLQTAENACALGSSQWLAISSAWLCFVASFWLLLFTQIKGELTVTMQLTLKLSTMISKYVLYLWNFRDQPSWAPIIFLQHKFCNSYLHVVPGGPSTHLAWALVFSCKIIAFLCCISVPLIRT